MLELSRPPRSQLQARNSERMEENFVLQQASVQNIKVVVVPYGMITLLYGGGNV